MCWQSLEIGSDGAGFGCVIGRDILAGAVAGFGASIVPCWMSGKRNRCVGRCCILRYSVALELVSGSGERLPKCPSWSVRGVFADVYMVSGWVDEGVPLLSDMRGIKPLAKWSA